MKAEPEIRITIKDAKIDDVRDPAFRVKARRLLQLYEAAPALRNALEEIEKFDSMEGRIASRALRNMMGDKSENEDY